MLNSSYNLPPRSRYQAYYCTMALCACDIRPESRRGRKLNLSRGRVPRCRSIAGISKISESYFNGAVRISELAFWVTCRSFRGERARERLHRIALLEARDCRPPSLTEREAEGELGRSDRWVCCRTGYLTNVRSKTCPGRLQTCFCNVGPRIPASHGAVSFFPYMGNRNFGSPCNEARCPQDLSYISSTVLLRDELDDFYLDHMLPLIHCCREVFFKLNYVKLYYCAPKVCHKNGSTVQTPTWECLHKRATP